MRTTSRHFDFITTTTLLVNDIAVDRMTIDTTIDNPFINDIEPERNYGVLGGKT
jgi:hypothetical protein